MTDYQPLDLSALCNSGVDALVEHAAAGFVKPPRDLTQPSAYEPQSPQSTPRIGGQMFQGLPFQIGGRPASEDSCYLLLGAGPGTDTASVKVDSKARNIIFVHRLLDSEIEDGGPLGVHVADYVVHLEGGESVTVPIRERFEISIVPPAWGGLPYRAVSDEKNSLPPRYVGAWEQAGRRQTEALRGAALDYFLWAWVNPQPDKTIEAIELVAKGPRFIVAGITLGHLDEHPFVRTGARELKIVLPNPEEASKPFTTEVEVDRGHTTFPYPLPAQSAEEFLADDFKGWGEEQNNESAQAYVEVAATRSATVTVKQDGESLGSAQWGEVEDKKVVQLNSKLRLELIDRGRNWVHTTVLDDDSGQPVPCRIHFRSIDGVPYQPHGHHSHVNSDMGTWHMDVGGDLRLGQATYAYIDGKCQGWLPRGDVIVDVARGFEYEPLRTRINIKPGQRELVLRIRRWRDMNKERWFSGDSHVHFLSTQGSHAESQGEDLNVVNLLQSQWGSLFTNVEEFVGGPSVSDGWPEYRLRYPRKQAAFPRTSDSPRVEESSDALVFRWAGRSGAGRHARNHDVRLGGSMPRARRHGHHPTPSQSEWRTGRFDRHWPGRCRRDAASHSIQPLGVLPLSQRRLQIAPGWRYRQDVQRRSSRSVQDLCQHSSGRGIHLRQLVPESYEGPDISQRRPVDQSLRRGISDWRHDHAAWKRRSTEC